MNWKKLGKALLYPYIAIMIVLTPISIALVVYSLVYLKSDSIFSIVSYVIAAYTLTVWCFRIPDIVKKIEKFKKNNKYARRWQDDDRLRVKISLYITLIYNLAYAVFQLWLGLYHHTFWYASLAIYYFSLAVMRFFLARHTSKYRPGEQMMLELKKYRICGWVFLVMNLALSLIVFFMVYWNRTFVHHEVTTIAMAAYTFTALTFAIINIVKYKKYNSPVYSASKAISLASAFVSLLTLESTMLTTFSDETMDAFTSKMLLGTSGGVIVLMVLAMAIYMIIQSTKKIRSLK